MKKEVLDYVVEKTNELKAAASCSKEAKDAADAWLAAVGTENETEETKKYIAELEEDIMPLDNLIAFAESEAGAKVFGDNAPNVAAHAKEIKAAGAKYCDCPACAAVEAILMKKDEMLEA
ncbi:MAG TPA: molecular chaperone Hsp90 [Candidatus Mediterraneibacter stercoripullorum]|nr:molecular chaperone Hsp90 [Candidatus Mediterraneibacter stercoripullorum]